MKKVILLLLILSVLTTPVAALEITVPEVPEAAADIMPDEPESFGEGLWELLKAVIEKISPELTDAAQVCLSIIAAALLTSLLQPMTGKGKRVAELVCTLAIAATLLQPARSMINLGTQTVRELSEYGKLFLPVMTAALAAQGGVTKSAALYAGTAMFDAALSAIISGLLVPMIYIFLVLAVANSAVGEDMLKKLRDFIKWLSTWILKIVLYAFTGYMGITGVINGTADAAAVKAAKLTISGTVPIVGGILSDASEAVLVSAGVVKSAAGIYGLLAILALWLEPFLQIGVQYLMLKMTAAVCSVFSTKQSTELIQDFSVAMGMLLAMTGTICLLLLISTVCFLKGVS